MLIFLPPIYKDEILYGIISRYHNLSGNLNYKDTIMEFFNSDTIIPTLAYPSLLENISSKLPTCLNYDSDFFVNNCTLFPIFSPFLPYERRNTIISEMKYHKGTKINNLLGVQAGHILEINKLKYCPLCSIGDYNKNGEAYYHRIHQAEGVFICSKHGCLIKEYTPDEDTSRLEFVRLQYDKLDLGIEYEKDRAIEKNYLFIAKSYEYLLTHNLSSFNNEIVYNKYIKFLDKMGLVTAAKRIKQNELIHKFTNFYGEELLSNLNCSIDQNVESSWLKNITRKQKNIIHPLRHILFINFLCRNIEEFFSEEFEFHPFGKGPWPCLNAAADHYKKDTVLNCKITSDYKSRVPVGTFECACGFTYSRKGPDEKVDDRYKVGRIKEFGHVWKNKLETLISEGCYNVRDLSTELNCDYNTIVKYAKMLCIDEKLNTKLKIKESGKEENSYIIYNNYKQELIEFIKQHPDLSRTEIRKHMEKQYIWLYRNNKEWLMDNLPVHIDKKTVNYNPRQRVNWNERDINICDSIKDEYDKIINSDELIRITRSLLGKRTGYNSFIEKCIEKLPLTNKLLNQICESIEIYQIRRIKSICKTLYEEKGEIKEWEVLRKAGIKSKINENMKPIVDNIINEFV